MTPTLNHEALDRMIHWITERHNIHLRRQAGLPKPWTTDKVLQKYFFTNPYRENDKVTVWFRENLRQPMNQDNSMLLPWATLAFRWFNYIPTGGALLAAYLDPDISDKLPNVLFIPPDPNKPTPYGLFSQWDGNVAKKTLWARERLGLHCFTGAYMIKIENYRGKIESCCDQISKQWEVRGRLFDRVLRCKTLEAAWKIFKQIEYIGGFMAYEIVTDLRHTYLLNEATDINTWCNLGPGAMRGISRLFNPDGRTPSKIESKNSLPKDILGTLRMLRDAINLKLTELNDCAEPSEDPDDGKLEFTYPLFEMRELEHTLCEFDKYERARLGQGTMKRKYPGTK